MSNKITIKLIIFMVIFNFVNASETKWIAIGSLHDWFSSAGCEKEIGRTGKTSDQLDGLRVKRLGT